MATRRGCPLLHAPHAVAGVSDGRAMVLPQPFGHLCRLSTILVGCARESYQWYGIEHAAFRELAAITMHETNTCACCASSHGGGLEGICHLEEM